MSLQTVRDQILQMTGRYDLGTPGGVDNGLNDLINQAQKRLDMETFFQYSPNQYLADVEADATYVDVSGIRALRFAWFLNSDNERTPLIIMRDLQDLRSIAPIDQDDVESGSPRYVALTAMRPGGSLANYTQSMMDARSDADNSDMIKRPTSFATQRLVLYPPPDAAITVYLEGLFYTPELENDSDATMWTELHPRALTLMTCAIMEENLRNTEGAKDYLTSLKGYLMSMHTDYVHQMMASNPDSVMGG